MLILIYSFFTYVMIPQIGAYASELVEPMMMVIVTLAGLVMLFGAVGMNISNNLGATIIGGIFRAIGYICRTLLQAVAWIIRNTCRMIPRVFNASKRTFSQMGLNAAISNILAVVLVIAFVVIII